MSYATFIIIMLFGNYVWHDPYYLTPKGKNPLNYSFMKSFLQTYTKFTFLLKVQVALRKADQVKRMPLLCITANVSITSN